MRKLPTVALTVALVATLATGAVTVAQESSSQATEIDSCTVIDEPGRYVLTANITNYTLNEDAEYYRCIAIRADDVVLDGDGHFLRGNRSDFGQRSRAIQVGDDGFQDRDYRNITVTDVRIGGQWDHGTVVRNVSDSVLTNVAVVENVGGSRWSAAFKIWGGSKNVTVADNEVKSRATGVYLAGVSNSTIRNNTFSPASWGVLVEERSRRFRPDVGHGNKIVENTIQVSGDYSVRVRANDTVVADNRLGGGAVYASGTNNTFRDNRLVDNVDRAFVVRGEENRIVDNTLRDPAERLTSIIGGNDTLVARNEFHGAGLSVVSPAGDGIVVRNNTVVGATFNEGLPTGGIWVEGPNVTIRDNVVRNSLYGVEMRGNLDGTVVRGNTLVNNTWDGVHFTRIPGTYWREDDSPTGTVHVLGNEITDNRRGVYVPDLPDGEEDDGRDGSCPVDSSSEEPGQSASNLTVELHFNTIAGNDGFGVLNEDERTVNATLNYWGTADGPSSNASDADAPFVDPVTERAADGSGDAVSEGSEAGVSNVHFDPFLTAST